MSIYMVTFCATDQEVGSNPFWHSCLLLSQLDYTTNKLKVIDKWGFYGTPASSPYPFIRKLKANLGLDTDFYGNHAMLSPEETRHLEQGRGLHGVTFELTEENFLKLKNKCDKMIIDQQDAIYDAVGTLGLSPTNSKKIRSYPYEHESYRIYQHELKLAAEQNRPPRLQEFSLCVWSEARTCKVHVLSLLEGILEPQQLERLVGWHNAVPRLSGKMEDIYLHSTGPLSTHTRRSGDIAYFRENKDVNLYWTLPPQEIDTLSKKSQHLLNIPEEHRGTVKKLVRQLQGLEWYFRNAPLEKKYHFHREQLVNQIIKLYEAFSLVEPKKSQVAKNDWTSFWRWLASAPRNVDEKILMDKIDAAKDFINGIYMAIVDGWEVGYVHAETKEMDEVDLVGLPHFMTELQQKEICQLIGRNYIEPENDYESDPEITSTSEAEEHAEVQRTLRLGMS